jgi:hypothetical protein
MRTMATRAQRESFYRLYMRDRHTDESLPVFRAYRRFRRRISFGGFGCFLVVSNGMTIGIEPDGYAHT